MDNNENDADEQEEEGILGFEQPLENELNDMD